MSGCRLAMLGSLLWGRSGDRIGDSKEKRQSGVDLAAVHVIDTLGGVEWPSSYDDKSLDG
jgi:hypothetical protein